MRIAIMSTPRSGNTWLRKMLAMLCDGEEIAVHSPDSLSPESLASKNCVLQLHWHRTTQVEQLLKEYGFKIVVLHRHPLDVLISILHFAHQEPQTNCWLGGEGGGENGIYKQSPISSAFLEYALGPRARALLSVSIEWSECPEATVIKYDELVIDTEKVLHELSKRLGLSQTKISEVVARNNIDALRLTADNGHFWQGKVGLWRKVLPFHVADAIVKNQQDTFSNYGYEIAPDLELTPGEAENNWKDLCR